MRVHVRCPNNPVSVRMSRKIPATTCAKGEPCACSRTITLRAEDDLQTRQRDLFGTTVWKASYSRRVAIESTNAEAPTHRADINRGYTRVFGLTGTSLLLAFGLAGLNVRILHDWHEIPGLPDPWAGSVDEPPDSRPRQKAINRRRRPTPLERLTSGVDPPIGSRPRH